MQKHGEILENVCLSGEKRHHDCLWFDKKYGLEPELRKIAFTEPTGANFSYWNLQRVRLHIY